MALAQITAYKIFEMMIIMVVGAAGYRAGIITRDGNRRLSEILVTIITPAMIFVSYQRPFDAVQMKGLLIALVLSFLSHIIGIIIAYVAVKKGAAESAIERFAVVFCNCGFMGLPLAQAIYGNEGVFYITAYVTAYNILVWTLGVVMMTGKSNVRSMIRAFLSPNIIAVSLGLICYVARFLLPDIIMEPVQMLADMNTPVAMLIAGSSLAAGNVFHMLKNMRGYYIMALRLLAVPAVFLGLLMLIHVNPMIENTILVATACPVGSMLIVLALRYDKNEIYGSELFGMSTVLCALTIPVMMIFTAFTS